MAGQGFKDFTVGEVLTSADVDGYLMQQSVMRFADSAARGSALGTAVGTAVPLAEGMLSYLADTDAVEVYDGSAWTAVGSEPPAGIGSNVVSAIKTNTQQTTSTSFVDVTDLTVTITPTLATSKVLVMAAVSVGHTGAGIAFVQMLRDATVIGSGTSGFGVSRVNSDAKQATLLYVDSPATTSATTYKVQFRSTANTARINYSGLGGDEVSSTLVAIEVAA